MALYDLAVSLLGTLPDEFKFCYVILTLVLGMMIVSFLFSVFYIPMKLIKGEW